MTFMLTMRLSPLNRFVAALETIVLKQTSGRIVLFVDEIDVVRSLPFSADEFFAAIRELYNRRSDDLQLARLTFGLFGVASPSNLIKDARITPFNIGRRIELKDFTRADAEVLAYGLGDNGTLLLDRIFHWTNGHPYLTQRLCSAAAVSSTQNAADIDKIVSELFLGTRAKDSEDNLKFVSDRLLRATDDTDTVLARYAEVQKGRRVADDDTDPITDVLRLSGIVMSENGTLKVRNRIYKTVFDANWICRQTTPAETRRQHKAYQEGRKKSMIIATFVTAVSLFSISGITLALQNETHAKNVAISDKERARRAEAHAIAEKERADSLLYIANMNLIQQYDEQENYLRVVDLLKETRKLGNSTFEWGYWNREYNRQSRTFRGHKSSVYAVCFSPDSKRVVTGSDDNTAKIWDMATGQEFLTLKGHTETVKSVTFSPDGKRVVTGGDDETAKVWDALTGKEIYTLRGHTNTVKSVAFSPNGKYIVTGSKDRTSKIWNAVTGKEIRTLRGHRDQIWSVAISPDNTRIVTGSADDTAKIWDTETGKELLTLRGHSSLITSVAFSPDGKNIATGSRDTTAKIWDAAMGSNIATYPASISSVEAVAFSPDGKHIAIGSFDTTAKIWNLEDGEVVKTLKGIAIISTA